MKKNVNEETKNEHERFSEKVLSGLNEVKFPEEALPQEILTYCRTVAKCLNLPIEYTVPGALFACAAANGSFGQSKVGPHRNLTIFWQVLLADTGKQKTQAMKTMAEPLFQFNREMIGAYNSICQELKNNHTDDKKSIDFPRKKRIVVSDATSESIDELHYLNEKSGVAIYSDEFSKFLGSMGKYNGARTSDKGRWLERYSNTELLVNRKGNGDQETSFSIIDSPENLLGGHQTARINMLIDKDAVLSGEYGRYSFFLPYDYKKGGIALDIPEEARKRYESLVYSIFRCQPADFFKNGFQRKTHIYHIGEKTHAAFQSFKNELDLIHNEAGEGSYLRGIEGKSLEKASRYALLFQVIDDAFNSEQSPVISTENMCRGIEIAKYHFLTSLEVAKRLKIDNHMGLTKSQILGALTKKFPKINISLLAQSLGIDRSNLYKMLR